MNFWGSNISWLLLIATLGGYFIVIYILSLFYPGYSHTHQVVSSLGNPKSPVASSFNISLIIFGILACVCAINFYIVYYSISMTLATIGAILLLFFGIGTGILGGLFSIDEEEKFKTVESIVHGVGEGIGFVSLSLLAIIISLISFKIADNVVAIESIIFFILCLVFHILFILSDKVLFKNPLISMNGLWQRLLLICMYMPLLLIAIKFIVIDNSKI